MSIRSLKTTAIAGVAVVAALGLAACSNSEKDSTVAAESTTASAAATTTSSDMADSDASLMLENAWVRAMDGTKDMTAIFGEVHNHGTEDVTITGFTASAEAASYEIHEVVDGKMRELEGGLVVPAGETVVLQPGHEHFMLMGVPTAIEAGDTVDLVLELSDGSTIDVKNVPVRTVGAGDEDYSDMHNHDHGDHGDHHEHGDSAEATESSHSNH